MRLVDISKLKRYEITYIPKFDTNSMMTIKRKLVIADSEDFAIKQITGRNKKAKILNLTILK